MKAKKTRFIIPRSRKDWDHEKVTATNLYEVCDFPVEKLLVRIMFRILQERKVRQRSEPA